jgi:hypothetical protein
VDNRGSKGDIPYINLLESIKSNELSLADFSQRCRAVNLLPGEARTYLNELGYDKVGSPLIEGDDELFIDCQTLELLKHELANSTC